MSAHVLWLDELWWVAPWLVEDSWLVTRWPAAPQLVGLWLAVQWPAVRWMVLLWSVVPLWVVRSVVKVVAAPEERARRLGP